MYNFYTHARKLKKERSLRQNIEKQQSFQRKRQGMLSDMRKRCIVN